MVDIYVYMLNIGCMNEREFEDGGLLREEIAMYETSPLAAPAVPSDPPSAGLAESQGSELVRTQVYLSVDQRYFLRSEGQRKGVSMAEALREIIAVAMRPPVVNWEMNPLLDAVAEDAGFESSGVGSQSGDASIYGQYQS